MFTKLWSEAPKGRIRCEGRNNIKIVVKEIVYDGVDWVRLAQDRVRLWDK
jgi:hypothetical protein